MRYSEKQIEEFADQFKTKLLSQPKQKIYKGLNIDVAYVLSGQDKEDLGAILNTNPNSNLFKTPLKPRINDGAETGL